MSDSASHGDAERAGIVPEKLRAKVAAIRDLDVEDLSSEELSALLAWGRRYAKTN